MLVGPLFSTTAQVHESVLSHLVMYLYVCVRESKSGTVAMVVEL